MNVKCEKGAFLELRTRYYWGFGIVIGQRNYFKIEAGLTVLESKMEKRKVGSCFFRHESNDRFYKEITPQWSFSTTLPLNYSVFAVFDNYHRVMVLRCSKGN